MFFQRFILAATIICTAALVTAQKPTPGVQKCNALISDVQNAIQKQADESCRTITEQIACTDDKTGRVVYTTLVAQPRCKTIKNNKVQKAMKNQPKAGAPKATSGDDPGPGTRPAAPYVDIMQWTCEAGTGLDLEVFVPGNATRCETNRYSYIWEIDGRKQGHAAQLQCICGRKAKVTVTDSQTGLSTTKEIDLMGCRN